MRSTKGDWTPLDGTPHDRTPLDWTPLLRQVQRRVRQRQTLRVVRGFLLPLSACLLLLGILRWLGYPVNGTLTLGLLLLCLVSAALVWAALAWRGRGHFGRHFGELDAARLTDQRAGLDGVLTTALTLPNSTPDSSPAKYPNASPAHNTDALETALQTRVRRQASHAAGQVSLRQVVPADPARTWLLPAMLLGAALGSWWLTPRPPSVPPAQASVVSDETLSAEPQTSGNPAAADSGGETAPAATSEPSAETSSLEGIPRGQEPDAPGQTPDAPQSDAGAGAGPVADVAVSSAGAFTPQRLREAREAILPSDTRQVQTRLAKGGGLSVDTPFGSREGGRVSQREAPSNPQALAAAPYDPTAAQGQAQQQKAPEGSTGLRSASGGRSVESDGDERCVDKCLTNNDMNRGGDTSRDAGKKPGSGVSAGTSGSGGQAASSSSGTGLGVGRLKDLETAYRQELLGSSNVNADQVQVLVAPSFIPPGQESPAGGVSGAVWRSAPEAPSPSADTPADAEQTVAAYFARTADRSNP